MKLKSILAVTIVTAFFISIFSFSSYAAELGGGVLTTTPAYPNAENLIWGEDTLVIDINYNKDSANYYFYRYQCPPDSKYCVTRTYQSATKKYNYVLHIFSNEPVKSYTITTANPNYQGTVADYGEYNTTWNGFSYYTTQVVSFDDTSTFLCRATSDWSVPNNFSIGSTVVIVYNTLWIYPSSSYVQNQQNHNEVMNGMIEGFSRVEDVITQVAGNILNAGASEIPSLDTDNEWMNDSLTKMNEWLSQMNDFKQQMDDSAEENESNMAQAKTFLTGLFDVIPASIIAVLTLCLVMIVVVKVVGR